MNTPDEGQIRVDADAVSRRAYARIADLALQVDQWQTAYEALNEEVTALRSELEQTRVTPRVVDAA